MGWLGMSSEGVAFRGADRFMESPDDIVDRARVPDESSKPPWRTTTASSMS